MTTANTDGILVTDNGVPVTKVDLLPGRTKYLTVMVNATSPPTLSFMGTTQTMEPIGNGRYTADIGLNATTPPGKVAVTAGALNYTFTVLPLLALESDVASLELTGTDGHTFTITGDDDFGTHGLTLRNAGNIDIDVMLARTSITANGQKASGMIHAQADQEKINVTSKATYLTTLAPGAIAPLTISSTMSANAPTGDYTTQLAFQLKKS